MSRTQVVFFAAAVALAATCMSGQQRGAQAAGKRERAAAAQAQAGDHHRLKLNWERPIPDAASLVRVLTPYTKPPEQLWVVLPDQTAVLVSSVEWASAGGEATDYRICGCSKESGGGSALCPADVTCDLCCKVERRPAVADLRTASPAGAAQADSVLTRAGLRRASGRPKSYPLDLVLVTQEGPPQQTISCMEKDSQGNCTHWRICGTTTGGAYRCYDVVKDPAFGWVVTWQ